MHITLMEFLNQMCLLATPNQRLKYAHHLDGILESNVFIDDTRLEATHDRVSKKYYIFDLLLQVVGIS